MNPIKVIYVLHSSSKHEGSNKSFLNMLEGLIDKGISPFVVLPFQGNLCVELDNRKIPYFLIPYSLSVYPKLNNLRNFVLFVPRLFLILFRNQKSLNKVVTLQLKIKAHLIHSNVGPLQIGYKAAKRLDIPHVWHLREYQTLDFKIHPLFSMTSFKKKLSMPNNYPVAITKGIFKYFSLNNSKAKIIYNPVFKESLIQFNNTKENYFLFAGRIEKSKGIRELLIAFFQFATLNNEYSLYIAGDTDDDNYLKSILALVDESSIKERVKFLGMRDDLSELMAKATALIVPSLYEGFGRITVEAMFNGCLVIGNNTAGTKEILEKENLGILYSGNDELVSAMKIVVSNGIESYYPLMKKAQGRAVTLYSQEQNVEAVYGYYQDILSQNKKLKY